MEQSGLEARVIDKSKFVNHFEFDSDTQKVISETWDERHPERSIREIGQTDQAVDFIHNLVPLPIVMRIRNQLDRNKWLAVGLDGMANERRPDQVGNYRLSNWNPDMADRLWERLHGFLPDLLLCDAKSPTDHMGHAKWRPVGVSPLFRYIRYASGGQLVAHYDGAFVENETRRTLMSLVIYLTTNQQGATRFLHDEQVGRDIEEYDFSDWDRAGKDEEVALRIAPQIGCGLMFGHRLLHDSEPLGLRDAEKIIIRTDVMFEKA